MTTRRQLIGALAATAAIAAVAAAAATAQGPPDKSGGSTPVTLTLLNGDSDLSGVPAVQHFIDRVRQLSGGTVTIEVRFANDGHPGYEQRAVSAVRANKAQLAWVGTRVWDTLGVNSLRALHAPLLVDSYAVEAAVLRSSLPRKMLAGLDGHGIVGLALLGDNLRYPAAVKHPLREPADFRGIRFRSVTSATQAAAVLALGARPSAEGWADLGSALASGRLDGMEIDLKTYEDNTYAGIAPYVTVNVALWPRTTTLFANAHALAALSEKQNRWIRQAADDAAAYSLTTFGEDQRIIPLECRNGMKGALATPAQIAALRRAFAPVYAALRKDAATAATIATITALKRTVKPTPLVIPKGCLAGNDAPATSTSPATFPEGVYRFTRTRADLLRAWPDADAMSLRLLAGTLTFTFRHGTFNAVQTGGGVPGCRRGQGRYALNGHLLTASWTSFHGCRFFHTPTDPDKLRWSYDGKLLRFRIIGAADPADHVTWETNPFVRIQ